MFISILTPCWNSARTIERTIKSVLQQNFIDYEYIIVDGGSTDGTIGIIKKYEPLFNGRMKWKSEPDRGIYDAFNKGIRQAKGKYVWIVNSDDWMTPNALDIIFEKTKEANEEAVLAFSLNFVDDKGDFIRKQFSGTDYAKYYRQDYIGIMHPATVVPKYNPQNEMFSHFGTKRYNFKNETQLFKVIPHTSKNQKKSTGFAGTKYI